MTKRMIRSDFSSERALKWLGWYYMKEAECHGGVFDKTEQLRKQLTSISELMTKSDKWGLFIMGQVGNGKTTAIKAVRSMINHLIREGYFVGEVFAWSWVEVLNAREMTRLYVEDYESFLDKMHREWLIIDDLGLDSKEVLVYGNKCYPFMELLDYRYENRLPTVISSNLKSEDLKNRYGDPRFSDRFNQMFNKITFRDKSFRSKS